MNKHPKSYTITNSAEKGQRLSVRFATMSTTHKVSQFRELGPSEKQTVEASDYLILISDEQTNYELAGSKALTLTPIQINNAHPRFENQTVAVYQLAYVGSDGLVSKSGDDDDGGSGGDVDVRPPKKPFP